MTTLYTAIAAARTAESEPLTPWFMLDAFANDWSILGGNMDLVLQETSLASATTPAWTDMVGIKLNMPTYAIDASFDDLEFVLAVRVWAKTDSDDCSIRLTDGTSTSNEVAVSGSSYSKHAMMLLPLDAIPTGHVALVTLQGMWNADPGSKTLNARRNAVTENLSDCAIYIRLVP